MTTEGPAMATMADTSVKLQVNGTHLRSLSDSVKISNCKIATEMLIATARINTITNKTTGMETNKIGDPRSSQFF